MSPETPAPAAEQRRHSSTSSRTKGIVAVAAGAVLLLGGGTTLALWTSTQSMNAGSVQAGDLDLALGTGSWTLDGLTGDAEAVADPSQVRIVPGDVLTLTQEVDVTLVGDTIEAVLSADTGDLLPPGAEDAFTVSLTLAGGGTQITPASYRLTPQDVAAPLTATLTITFDQATPDREHTNTAIDLDEVSFTLTQAAS